MSILIVVRCFKIGIKLGVFNIAIYGEKIRCSFNSFEQCSKTEVYRGIHFVLFLL